MKILGGYINKFNIFLVVFIIFYSFVPALLFAQVNTAWVVRYNGPGNGWDYAYAIAFDGSGNVYVTGNSPGSGTFSDYATIKYRSHGTQEWVVRYNGPANYYDDAYAIALDGSGNIYVTGRSCGSGEDYDYATIKYNSAGVQQWVQRYNGIQLGMDKASAIAVDNSGNVYVTGYSGSPGTPRDYATIKYNSNGVQQWVQRYNGPGNDNDEASAIAVDNSGNVYVTGYSPAYGTDYDYATIKYNSAGVQQWVARYNGPLNYTDYANAIAIDNLGNIYVTGYSYGSGTDRDYATIKYNSAGAEQWVQRYNGPGTLADWAEAIVVDGSGNIYVTGGSRGSGTSLDYATIKYNSTGVQQWVQRYNGPGNDYDYASAIAVDNNGNVYITGASPGSDNISNCATIKYNSQGVQQWVQRYNGPGNGDDWGQAIAVDEQSNVYVTSTSYGSGTMSDYATIKYVQTGAVEENREAQTANRNSLEVFPNPASSFFTIHSPLSADLTKIKIFNVTGKLVGNCHAYARNDNTVRISLNGIKNGIYFVQVNDEIIKEKLVVTK
jgi:uncharacterized delta-60 repeat protein